MTTDKPFDLSEKFIPYKEIDLDLAHERAEQGDNAARYLLHLLYDGGFDTGIMVNTDKARAYLATANDEIIKGGRSADTAIEDNLCRYRFAQRLVEREFRSESLRLAVPLILASRDHVEQLTAADNPYACAVLGEMHLVWAQHVRHNKDDENYFRKKILQRKAMPRRPKWSHVGDHFISMVYGYETQPSSYTTAAINNIVQGAHERNNEKAGQLLDTAALAGDPASQYFLAQHLREFPDMTTDQRRMVVALLVDSAKGGFVTAQFDLAELGIKREASIPGSATTLSTSSLTSLPGRANSKTPGGSLSAETLDEDRWHQQHGTQLSEDWFWAAGKQGHPESQYRLGCLLRDKNVHDEAVEWFFMAAHQEHIPAMVEAATYLARGTAGNVNVAEAFYAANELLTKHPSELNPVQRGRAQRIFNDAIDSKYEVVDSRASPLTEQGQDGFWFQFPQSDGQTTAILIPRGDMDGLMQRVRQTLMARAGMKPG